MKKSLRTDSPRLLDWALRIERYLHEIVPGVETQVIQGAIYDEFSPHRTALHVRYLLPETSDELEEAVESVGNLVTDALVDTGRMIYVLPGLIRAEAQRDPA